ncbi:MAG TPA: CoA pyrophosphatase [Alphaproteobacteria bacterium]|nr:CoA pyrophosphatase [Alphaproteobacteria bacterium]
MTTAGHRRISLASRDDLKRRLAGAAGDIGIRRAGVRVANPTARVRGDHDLNPDLAPTPPLTPAAVLVPIVDRAGAMTVLLTRRTGHLHAHAGQISFPGGRLEADDADAAAAALRETEEETGIDRARIEIAGRLDTYQTRTGFEITPFVGVVHPPFTLNPDRFEVAEVFEVPLEFVLDPANHQRHMRIERNIARYFYVVPFGEYFIWGATAGMLVNLYEALAGGETSSRE